MGNDKTKLRQIESKIVDELLWHLGEGAEQINFSALIDCSDDETTFRDLLYAAEHLRKKIRE